MIQVHWIYRFSMEEQEKSEGEGGLMRLNKYLAHCGICTRKEAVDLIKKGRVKVNDEVVLEPFYVVRPSDVIQYGDNVVTPKKSFTYILFNKGSRSTVLPVEGSARPSVTELAHKNSGHKLNVALSLDDHHCGLMLLSDDPQFLTKMEDKSRQMSCTYEVQCTGHMPEDLIAGTRTRENCKIIAVDIIESGEMTKFTLDVKGAHDRELAMVLTEAGCKIEKLDRLRIGALTKKDLKRGWSRPLTEKEIIFLSYFG
jgi:23S rRNA pseudouridine2605 synthase